MRYGLAVVEKYDNKNTKWLAMDSNPDEWAVSFHGISNPELVLPKIIVEGLRVGPR